MSRQSNLERLQDGSTFDLLVIGGGATGCGIALDAATRGLKVALVEKNDFAEGTSGRSTKLLHGGVRYLEMAIKKLDKVQYNLVRDGLRERHILLHNAPHLTNRLTLVTPLYNWIDIPYVFSGLKLYDILAGKRNIGHSRLLSRKQALQRFPRLKAEGLKAGVLYYDGQFNDARMAVSIALTAGQQGAIIANHVNVTSFLKENGKVAGAELCNALNGNCWQLKSKGVINATGPFTDQIRLLDNPAAQRIVTTSTGIHIVLEKGFAPPDTALMIPKTEDGRVLFILPWQGHAMIGTTDEPTEPTEHPRAQPQEVDYLLRHAGRYFNLQLKRSDIKAVWSGLRPLVSDPKATDTARLSRDHVIEISSSGLLTIAGGKWTTYRKMALDAVDQALKVFSLSAAKPTCQTADLPLIGAADYSEQGGQNLEQQFGLAADIASHLNQAYGDRAVAVAALAKQGYSSRLAKEHPYLDAEVLYATRHELAIRVIDVLARRLPLALLDTDAARQAIPRVAEIMAAELDWDQKKREEEMAWTEKRLGEAL